MDVLNNPSLTCFKNQAPVAQLDRVPGYEPGGRRFESVRARHLSRFFITTCDYQGVRLSHE
ncbi:MAG: hypothetical protein HW411_264 [Gammaproteobacteria bacterium]|nr:hypothetical protein [Gammaproteobacteria bacterium]